MNPHDIQAALKKSGSSQKRIAEELGVETGAVCLVLHGKRSSRRVAQHIADRIGQDLDALWPGKYRHSKSSTKARPIRRAASQAATQE